jgi:hypothetical protein
MGLLLFEISDGFNESPGNTTLNSERKERQEWISCKERLQTAQWSIFYRRHQTRESLWCGIDIRDHFLNVDFVKPG